MNVLRHAARRADQRVYASSLRSRWYSTLPRVCSSCSAPLLSALPTCTNCSHIEPIPDTTTYFDILGLASSRNKYKLDTKDLRMRFLQAQRVCHPDAWSGKGQKEQEMAAAQSSILNSAYRTLSSPVLRAQYILAQEGYPPLETDKLTDQELIMEVMEAREELEEASSPDAVEIIRERNDSRIQDSINAIEQLILDKNWEAARDAVVKLKYLEGIEIAAKDKWHELSR